MDGIRRLYKPGAEAAHEGRPERWLCELGTEPSLFWDRCLSWTNHKPLQKLVTVASLGLGSR